MKKVLFLLAILACALSCKRPIQKKATVQDQDFLTAFFTVMNDTTATWDQVKKATYTFTDSLFILTLDTRDRRRRITAEKFSYFTIDILTEKLSEMRDAGKYVNVEDIPPILDRIHDIVNAWFYSPYDNLIWKDMYYVSHKESDNPVEGDFYIAVALPTKDYPQGPQLHVFYPNTAENGPRLAFGKSLTDLEENVPTRAVVPDSWDKKDEEEKGSPMHAVFGPDAVEMMLDNNVMYLTFQSGASPDGAPGGFEVARLELEPFHMKYKDVAAAHPWLGQ